METFIKIQNVRINVVYISYYKTKIDDDGEHHLKIHIKDAGYADDLEFNYKGELASKRFSEDLKKLDTMLLAHNN